MGKALEKFAGYKEVASRVKDAAVDTGKKVGNFFKKDYEKIKDQTHKIKTGPEVGYSNADIGGFKKNRLKAISSLAGKTIGTAGAVGATGYSAKKIFDKKDR